jgi:hypothetical protein
MPETVRCGTAKAYQKGLRKLGAHPSAYRLSGVDSGDVYPARRQQDDGLHRNMGSSYTVNVLSKFLCTRSVN